MNNYIVRIFLDDLSILEYELKANTASKASEKALKKYYRAGWDWIGYKKIKVYLEKEMKEVYTITV